MLTPKIILYKHKTYSDGSHPIILQVIKNGKAVRKVIARCQAKEWLPSKNRVGSKNLMYIQINDAIDDALRNFGIEKKQSFQDFYQKRIDIIKEKQQVSLYTLNKRVFAELLAYKKDIDFEHIDERFITAFAAHLRKTSKVNTIRIKMQNFSKIMKEAYKENLIERNPMEHLTFKKEKTVKSKLNLDELQRIISLELTGKTATTRDIFIACVLMRGMRIGDALLLTQENIKDGRLRYREEKTGKLVNIEIVPALQEIFDRCIGQNPYGFIFDFIKVPVKVIQDRFLRKKHITSSISRVRYYLANIAKLADIQKEISSHTARHSFSVLARTTIQDTTITKDLVGHSSLAIHESYISEISDNTVLDVYAKKILDKLK